MTEQKKKMTFEQAMDKLEQIVAGIEGGEISLEESIEKYAEGTGLIKQCRAILDAAEKKVQILAHDGAQGLEVTGELEDDSADATQA